jgi:hypothetical protein
MVTLGFPPLLQLKSTVVYQDKKKRRKKNNIILQVGGVIRKKFIQHFRIVELEN